MSDFVWFPEDFPQIMDLNKLRAKEINNKFNLATIFTW